MDSEDRLEVTTFTNTHTHTVTPEKVEREARRIAMRFASILANLLGEHNITEKELAASLEVHPRQIRALLVGENYKSYLAIAAVYLVFDTKIKISE